MTLTINIAYLLRDSQQQEAVALSNSVNTMYWSKIILNDTSVLPHITLYKAKFEEEAVPWVIEAVASCVEGESSISTNYLRIEKIFDGWVFVQYEVSQQLKILHKNLIEAINSLRNTWVGDSRWRDQNFLTPRHEQYQEQYWSYFILDYFQPHVTAWLINSTIDFDQSKFEINSNLRTVVIDKVSVCIWWKHGTIVDVIDSFSLSV